MSELEKLATTIKELDHVVADLNKKIAGRDEEIVRLRTAADDAFERGWNTALKRASQYTEGFLLRAKKLELAPKVAASILLLKQ